MAIEALERLRRSIGCDLETHRTTVGSYEISYVTGGSGPPCVLIHGANLGWAQWYGNIPALAQHFTIYGIDLPGAGESTKIEFSRTRLVEDYVQIVDRWIRQLGLSNLAIVAHSFGGWIAMRLAVDGQPYIQRMVLANPIGFTTAMPLRFRPISLTPFARLLSRTALKPVRSNRRLETFLRDPFYDANTPLPAEFVDYFYELSAESHNLLFISRLAHWSGMRRELFLGEEAKLNQVPTEVIWGREDKLMPLESILATVEKIRHLKLEVLDGVGHIPPVEARDTFNERAISYLSA